MGIPRNLMPSFPLLFRGGAGVVAQRKLRSRSDLRPLHHPPTPSSEEEGEPC